MIRTYKQRPEPRKAALPITEQWKGADLSTGEHEVGSSIIIFDIPLSPVVLIALSVYGSGWGEAAPRHLPAGT